MAEFYNLPKILYINLSLFPKNMKYNSLHGHVLQLHYLHHYPNNFDKVVQETIKEHSGAMSLVIL